MAVVRGFAYVSDDIMTNLTITIEVDEIDEDRFGLIKCAIRDHPGTNPSLEITKADDVGPSKSK